MSFNLAKVNLKVHLADMMTVAGYMSGGAAFCEHQLVLGCLSVAVGMAGQTLHDVWRSKNEN